MTSHKTKFVFHARGRGIRRELVGCISSMNDPYWKKLFLFLSFVLVVLVCFSAVQETFDYFVRQDILDFKRKTGKMEPSYEVYKNFEEQYANKKLLIQLVLIVIFNYLFTRLLNKSKNNEN